MLEPIDLTAGIEPGLRFALILDGQAGGHEVDWQGVNGWRPEHGVLWVHLERDAPETEAWLRERSGLDPFIVETLLAEDSRPRIEPFDDDLLLVLRGVNIEEKDEVELVPIHIWIAASRAISLRDSTHTLGALRDIRVAVANKRGPRTAGGVLVRIAEKIVRDLEPVIDSLEDDVDRLEMELTDTQSEDLRRTLGDIRRQAVHLRRYLLPQRDALLLLRDEDTPLISDRDRMRLGGVVDWIVRHIEDLDAIHRRTEILREELSAQVSERIAKTTHRFTVIAALLLPPSLIAALLGANIGGIPGHDTPNAFLILIGLTVVLLIVQLGILRLIRWL